MLVNYPFFDLARIEATSLNGNISSFSKDGEIYLTLANEYTYDGGHLNEEGSKRAAEQLLIFLANIPQ